MTENKLSRNWILASAKHTCPRAGVSDMCNSIREALADSRGFSDIFAKFILSKDDGDSVDSVDFLGGAINPWRQVIGIV